MASVAIRIIVTIIITTSITISSTFIIVIIRAATVIRTIGSRHKSLTEVESFAAACPSWECIEGSWFLLPTLRSSNLLLRLCATCTMSPIISAIDNRSCCIAIALVPHGFDVGFVGRSSSCQSNRNAQTASCAGMANRTTSERLRLRHMQSHAARQQESRHVAVPSN